MAGHPIKLLIVGERPDHLQALRAAVCGPDGEPHIATSGEQALALLRQHDYALAVLDLREGGMDGFDPAALIRDIEATRRQRDAVLAELSATQDQLRHALRMRDEFMSTVSHEMRTPINTLYLETQLRQMQLERGDMTAFEPEQLRRMLARDDRQIRSIIRLIDDMLDVSRIRCGRLSIRPSQVELSELLRRVVSDLAPQASAARCSISLQADTPVTGCWDEFRIEQIVVNLLTNALRYGGRKPVTVTLAAEPEQVRIEVRDQGGGIAPENLEKIFEPYERGVNNGTPTGLGLGLYISRQLAEAHQGSLTARSARGQGATFTLTLPRSAAGQAGLEQAA